MPDLAGIRLSLHECQPAHCKEIRHFQGRSPSYAGIIIRDELARGDFVKRYGQVLHLRPEHRDEYVRQHAAVWPGVLEQIRRSNIRNYSIFLRDGALFAYFEYVGDDFAADMRAMAADPETQRWWALMEPMQQKWPSASAEEWWANMTEVFHVD